MKIIDTNFSKAGIIWRICLIIFAILYYIGLQLPPVNVDKTQKIETVSK